MGPGRQYPVLDRTLFTSSHLLPLMNQAPQNSSPSQRSSESRSSDPETQVLIIDDHPAIREALSGAIEREEGMDVMDALGTSADLHDFLEEHVPDVFVVDISLGDGDGLALIETIHSQRPEIQMLVYSMHDEGLYAGRALRAGAQGYVHKSAPTDTVIAAIRRVERGEIYLSQKIASQILTNVVRNQRYGSRPVEQLTDRELTVFRMIGMGKSVQEIADQLELSRKTVETYRRRAKEKLGYETVDELLRFALQWKENR